MGMPRCADEVLENPCYGVVKVDDNHSGLAACGHSDAENAGLHALAAAFEVDRCATASIQSCDEESGYHSCG